MRKAVGILAIALPIVLVTGNILLSLIGPAHALPQPLLQPSISAYYYTVTGRFLIGSLCAIAMFLMSCQGYDRNDELTGYLACTFAIGVAFFPTTDPRLLNPPPLARHIATVHLTSATLLFFTLAYFCLYLFRKTDPAKEPTLQKLHRNLVYSICGWTIVGAIVVITALNLFPPVEAFLRPIDPVFSFETVSLLAFGTAWLTKGEAILPDKPPQASTTTPSTDIHAITTQA